MAPHLSVCSQILLVQSRFNNCGIRCSVSDGDAVRWRYGWAPKHTCSARARSRRPAVDLRSLLPFVIAPLRFNPNCPASGESIESRMEFLPRLRR